MRGSARCWRCCGPGKRVALVSDAGTPLLSDPGFRLVRAAIAEGLPVSAVPGPNAALTALVLSGLPPVPFLFLGFPPPRAAARRAGFGGLRAAERAGLAATLIWHEAPHRLAETLADMAAAFGDRPAAVARELTKRFEEVRRGTLAELAAYYAATPVRGEVTVLVGPACAGAADAEGLDERLRSALAAREREGRRGAGRRGDRPAAQGGVCAGVGVGGRAGVMDCSSCLRRACPDRRPGGE